jgi:cobalamin biosynthesis protein CobT
MTKSSAKTTTSHKSTKATKGSVGFIHGGTFRQGLFRIFKSDDKDPSETLAEFHQYYGQKLSGRYVNVESVDEIYEKFLEHYQKEKVNGTETVFKTSTMKSVCDTLKDIAEVSKCHLIKSDSSEEGDEAEEAEETEEKETKSSKSSKKEEAKPKQTSSKKAQKEESEDEDKSESEHSEQEEEEEEKPAPKSSKGKTSAKKGKVDKKDDDSDDEGEKLQKKSKSGDKAKKSGKGK